MRQDHLSAAAPCTNSDQAGRKVISYFGEIEENILEHWAATYVAFGAFSLSFYHSQRGGQIRGRRHHPSVYFSSLNRRPGEQKEKMERGRDVNDRRIMNEKKVCHDISDPNDHYPDSLLSCISNSNCTLS